MKLILVSSCTLSYEVRKSGCKTFTLSLHEFTIVFAQKLFPLIPLRKRIKRMKKVCLLLSVCTMMFPLILCSSCKRQEKASDIVEQSKEAPSIQKVPPNQQVAEYIRHIFQDKNGNFWFGTNGYGIAHYNGNNVSYYSNAQGFGGQQITGITEDLNKNIWFATDRGIVKYDWSDNKDGNKQFINYPNQQYFGGQRFWSIFADSKGYIWAGAEKGIFRFDGFIWAPFDLPYPEGVSGDFITSRTSWSITEDSHGNIWFSTNGYGAFKYDQPSENEGRESFTQYSEEDGLTDNSVDVILEDSKGNIWFGTRHGGVSQYNHETFTNYTSKNNIGDDEVCIIYEDKAGNIWFSSEGFGVYRYDGTSFTNYGQDEGLGVRAIQDIFEDREGRLWVGGGGGLYRLKGGTFINVTRDGPWE